MAEIADSDIADELSAQVAAVAAAGGEIEIVGGGSKRFYGEPVEALALEVAGLPGASLYVGSWSEWCRNLAALGEMRTERG